jgi:GDP-4-dehydro-6-deoxy-D-mannose reductase
VNNVILVTGASGFAGGHLLRQLAAPDRVVGWSRSQPAADVADLARWQTVDLLDRSRVRAAIDELRPGIVYHCAGVPHVAESWRDAARPLASHALGTHHLFDAMRRASLRARVLVVSSAAVYAPADAPLTEDARLAPANPYGRSKLAQEQLGLRARAEDGLDVIVTRPFNHTGPRQAPAFVAPSIARQIALIERGAADPVIRVGNLDAHRDLSDVRDVVRAYTALMERGTPGTIYNVASGTPRRIGAVLDALIARARVPVRTETDAARLRSEDTPMLVGDATRLRETTGWQPAIGFERMLDDLLDYWRQAV